ncbi:hypothetical protein RPMD05_29 [Rhodobacteraceae phage LS06-2018-MD05]|nr:hypothetical protein RPMD05_29 [Rhodobacteraceae phage LS06-2018-MD05]
MDEYTIKQAYPWCKFGFEIEISSKNLIYAELGKTHIGCQSLNMDNNEIILEKCKQVADLIREIDELNKI